MIKVQNLNKELGGTTVFKNLSLEVERGEFLALIGKSGDGKSVLLKHLAGLMQPDSGSVVVEGYDLCCLKRRQRETLRRKFGFVFQNGALFDSLTVYDNVAFPLRENTKLDEKTIRNKVMDELQQVELPGAENKYPAELSGGMIKRVALARSLITEPEFMFFDEPCTGLDPLIGEGILNLIHECWKSRGFTGIIVTHQYEPIFQIVNKVALLYDNTIYATGSPDEIKTSDNSVVQSFLHSKFK